MRHLLILISRICFKVKEILANILLRDRYFDFTRDDQNSTQPITFNYWFDQHILRINSGAYWPVHRNSKVAGVENILVGKGSFPGYMPGCYIQGLGVIVIGEYSIFAPNVGIISANHDIRNHALHKPSRVRIGSYCWVGMNSVILPGVELGDFTIVAAGSVVKDSFREGYCIIAGNPAEVVKLIDPKTCIKMNSTSTYRGYILDKQFTEFAQKRLSPQVVEYLQGAGTI
jgi:acetyltransferase-like isoleucine patch superfamily enzyme